MRIGREVPAKKDERREKFAPVESIYLIRHQRKSQQSPPRPNVFVRSQLIFGITSASQSSVLQNETVSSLA